MNIRIGCAMCDKSKDIEIDTNHVSYGKTLGDVVLDAKWIYQQNDGKAQFSTDGGKTWVDAPEAPKEGK